MPKVTFVLGLSGSGKTYHGKKIAKENKGIRLRRDSWMSVMYAEGLNSITSSATLQRTDRHEILGQKPSDFQVFL